MSEESNAKSSGVSWGNIFTGTLILGVIGFLIVGIPTGVAAAKLFGAGSNLWWIALSVVGILWLVKRRS